MSNQYSLGTGQSWRFHTFRKTDGYANQPLDGIWARAPYLHNGSVPTLRHLLEPAKCRPKTFYRGNDVYDKKLGGFTWDLPSHGKGKGKERFLKFDVSRLGNRNVGHDGAAYGTDLPSTDKDALVEYLKTL